MTLLSGLLSPDVLGAPVRIGDMVHLWVRSRPQGDKCTAAVVTRVRDTGLSLVEFAAYSDHRPVHVPSTGFPHMSEAPSSLSSWHTRAECPDGR